MWFKTVSNFVEQHQYFGIFQQLDWEFDQDADFKKLVSFITAGILIGWWLQTLVSWNAKPTPPSPIRALTVICIAQSYTMLWVLQFLVISLFYTWSFIKSEFFPCNLLDVGIHSVYLKISYFSMMESYTNLDLHLQFVYFFCNELLYIDRYNN